AWFDYLANPVEKNNQREIDVSPESLLKKRETNSNSDLTLGKNLSKSMQRLINRGKFVIDEQLDLHNLNKNQAYKILLN
mgnify:CR=1